MPESSRRIRSRPWIISSTPCSVSSCWWGCSWAISGRAVISSPMRGLYFIVQVPKRLTPIIPIGMMGVNLFGTCTMKYNPRIGEEITARPEIAQLHPHQHDDTLQGVLEMIHGLDLILRELSGMDQFVFQAGGGADAAYTHA